MSNQVPGTHFQGPILGSDRSMGGALEDAPVDVFARTQWVSYFNDFTRVDIDYVTTTDWSLTQVSGGGSASLIPLDQGILRLDCPADEDGPIIQFDSSQAAGLGMMGITPAAAVANTSEATDAVFAARFRITDVSASGIFVGLAELNSESAIIATPEGGITSDTHAGFAQTDANAGAIIFTATGAAAAAATTVTGTNVIPNALADNEYIEVAVRVTGTTRTRGYVREGGTRWRQIADFDVSAAFANQMLVSFANIGGAAGDDLDIDYVYFAAKRDLIIPA